jgi:hypothetical protein
VSFCIGLLDGVLIMAAPVIIVAVSSGISIWQTDEWLYFLMTTLLPLAVLASGYGARNALRILRNSDSIDRTLKEGLIIGSALWYRRGSVVG